MFANRPQAHIFGYPPCSQDNVDLSFLNAPIPTFPPLSHWNLGQFASTQLAYGHQLRTMPSSGHSRPNGAPTLKSQTESMKRRKQQKPLQTHQQIQIAVAAVSDDTSRNALPWGGAVFDDSLVRLDGPTSHLLFVYTGRVEK